MPTRTRPNTSKQPPPGTGKAKVQPPKPAPKVDFSKGEGSAASRGSVRMMDQREASDKRTWDTINGVMDNLSRPPSLGPTNLGNTLSARGAGEMGGEGSGSSGGGGLEPSRPLGGFRQNADGSRTWMPPAQKAQVGTPRMGDVGTVFSNAATNPYDRQVSQTMAGRIQSAMTPADHYQNQRYSDRLAAYNLPGAFGEEAMAAVDHYQGSPGVNSGGYRPVSQTYRQGLQKAQDAGLNMSSNRVQQAVLAQMSNRWGAPATQARRQAVEAAGTLDTQQIAPMVQADSRFAPAYERARRRELEQKAMTDQRLLDRQLATWGVRNQGATQVQELKNQGGLKTQEMKGKTAESVQGMRNDGRLQNTEKQTEGRLKVQGSRNEGALAVQGSRNQGAANVQGMRGKTAESVQGMRNQGASTVQNLRNQGNVDATELKNQGRIDAQREKAGRVKPGAPMPGRLGANPLESIVNRYFGPRQPAPGVGGPVGAVPGGGAVDDPQFSAIPQADRQMLDSVPQALREAKAQELEQGGHPVAAAYLRSR